jgi:hypothetical protein
MRSSIRGFRSVFEIGILYYPKKKGINLLFRKDNYDATTFQRACEQFGYEEVMNVAEDALVRHSDTVPPPLNIVEALITAAIDENIHLDCVYFLFRREPDVLQKLPSSVPPAAVIDNNNIGIENNNGNNDENDNLSKRKTNPKKRKRKVNVG